MFDGGRGVTSCGTTDLRRIRQKVIIGVREQEINCTGICVTASSDGPALSLDINQPAANPAALAMAILSSTKSRKRAGSSPQVPLVIISQPLPGPVTGQAGPAPQIQPETAHQSGAATDGATAPADLGSYMDHISSEPDPPSSTNMSLPVTNDQPTRDDAPTSGEEETVVVSLCILTKQKISL